MTRITRSGRPTRFQPIRRRRPSRRSTNANEQPWYAKTRGIHKLSSSTNLADLSGKVAVVTGAAAGLGRAEAIGLARAGATIVVNDIAAALDASDVVDEIAAAGSKAVPVPGDISQRATADDLISSADALGGLSIVVNNAGIT